MMRMASLESVVRGALDELADLQPTDQAAAELALRMAAEIEAGAETLKDMGPKLLSVLESLGMTPRSRKALVGKAAKDDDVRRSPLDELRARRARLGPTATVDTAPA